MKTNVTALVVAGLILTVPGPAIGDTVGSSLFDAHAPFQGSSQLQVTDPLDSSMADTHPPDAEAGPNRTVRISTVGGDVPVTFNGSNSSDNTNISTYKWSFGDGSTATGTVVTHNFTSAGTYTVNLTAIDPAGNVGSDTTTVLVKGATWPYADAGPNRTIALTSNTPLDGTGSTDIGNIIKYQWFLSNGSTVTTPTLTRNYSTPGHYFERLQVTDDDGHTDTDRVDIWVKDKTGPTADAGPDKSAVVHQPVSLDGSNSSDNNAIVQYNWDAERKSLRHGVAPVFNYSNTGTYNVTLTVVDGDGNADTDTTTLVVQHPDDRTGPNLQNSFGPGPNVSEVVPEEVNIPRAYWVSSLSSPDRTLSNKTLNGARLGRFLDLWNADKNRWVGNTSTPYGTNRSVNHSNYSNPLAEQLIPDPSNVSGSTGQGGYNATNYNESLNYSQDSLNNVTKQANLKLIKAYTDDRTWVLPPRNQFTGSGVWGTEHYSTADSYSTKAMERQFVSKVESLSKGGQGRVRSYLPQRVARSQSGVIKDANLSIFTAAPMTQVVVNQSFIEYHTVSEDFQIRPYIDYRIDLPSPKNHTLANDTRVFYNITEPATNDRTSSGLHDVKLRAYAQTAPPSRSDNVWTVSSAAAPDSDTGLASSAPDEFAPKLEAKALPTEISSLWVEANITVNYTRVVKERTTNWSNVTWTPPAGAGNVTSAHRANRHIAVIYTNNGSRIEHEFKSLGSWNISDAYAVTNRSVKIERWRHEWLLTNRTAFNDTLHLESRRLEPIVSGKPTVNVDKAVYPDGSYELLLYFDHQDGHARVPMANMIEWDNQFAVQNQRQFSTYRNRYWDYIVESTGLARYRHDSFGNPVQLVAVPTAHGMQALQGIASPVSVPYIEFDSRNFNDPAGNQPSTVSVGAVNDSYSIIDEAVIRVENSNGVFRSDPPKHAEAPPDTHDWSIHTAIPRQQAKVTFGRFTEVLPSQITATRLSENETHARLLIRLQGQAGTSSGAWTPIDTSKSYRGNVTVGPRVVETNTSGMAVVTVERVDSRVPITYNPTPWRSFPTGIDTPYAGNETVLYIIGPSRFSSILGRLVPLIVPALLGWVIYRLISQDPILGRL